jgi:HEAT repeats
VRKRSRIVFITLGLVLIGLVAWKVVRPQEPIYQGKPLSVWLRPYHFTLVTPERKETDKVVRQVGTNAIPTLLNLLQAREQPPFVIKLMKLAQKTEILDIHYYAALEKHFMAARGFQELGSIAEPAVMELIKVYEKNSDISSKCAACSALGGIGPPAKTVVPSLLRNITNANVDLHAYSLLSLGGIRSESELVVPALITSLKDPYPPARAASVRSLSRFGTNAKPAVPALIALYTRETNSYVKNAASDAVVAISPQDAGKVGGE